VLKPANEITLYTQYKVTSITVSSILSM